MKEQAAVRQEKVESLIAENMRLVLKIANDFLGRGLPWDDLVSEGNRGLITAAGRYDETRGAKFSTYSAWWIEQAIRQAIAEQALTVRVPIGTQLNSRRIKRTSVRLTQELGRIPTDEEVAAALHLPLVTIQRLRHKKQVDIRSLNTALCETDPESAELIDFFVDEQTPPPDQELTRLEDIEQLLTLLETLPSREQQVLKLRFGLDGEPIRKLDELGEMLGCTNERVRQIQNQALKKLQKKMLAAL